MGDKEAVVYIIAVLNSGVTINSSVIVGLLSLKDGG